MARRGHHQAENVAFEAQEHSFFSQIFHLVFSEDFIPGATAEDSFVRFD